MGPFRNVESVAMAVRHVAHRDGLGGPGFNREFVGRSTTPTAACENRNIPSLARYRELCQGRRY